MTTAEERRILAADREKADVIAIVAKALTWTPETHHYFEEYARHPWSHVRTAIAGNPTTPPEILQTLVYDHWLWVREQVANNPNSSETTLLFLAQSKKSDYFILKALASNPNRTTTIMRALASRRTGAIHKIASDPLTPLNIIRRYARSKNPELVAWSLTNQTLPDSQEKAATAEEEILIALLNQNRGIHWRDYSTTLIPEHMIDMFEHKVLNEELSYKLAYTLVTHPQTRGNMLAVLTEKWMNDINIITKIAHHKNTTSKTLTQLATHPDKKIRDTVARHANCPEEAKIAIILLS